MDRRETATTSTVRAEPVHAEARGDVLSRTLSALRALDPTPAVPEVVPAQWFTEAAPGPDGVAQGQFVLDMGRYGQVLGPTPELGLIVGEALSWGTGTALRW